MDAGLFPACGSCNSHSAVKSFPGGMHNEHFWSRLYTWVELLGQEVSFLGWSALCELVGIREALMAGETWLLGRAQKGKLLQTLQLKSANTADSSHRGGLNRTGRWRWVSQLCELSWASTFCSQSSRVQAPGPLQSHQDVHC